MSRLRRPLLATARWLLPDLPSESEARERARLFLIVTGTTMAAVTAVWSLLMLMEPERVASNLRTLLVVDGLGIVLLWINRRGATRAASWVLIAGLVGIVSFNIPANGGIHAPGLMAFVVISLMAGLLVGEVGGIVTSVACAAVVLFFALQEMRGAGSGAVVALSPLGIWLRVCIYMAVTLVLQRMAAGILGKALRRAEAEVAERKLAQQRLTLALNTGQIGAWELDPATRVLRADAMLFERYGIPQPPDGRIDIDRWVQRIHPGDRTRATEVLMKVASEGGSGSAEFRVLRPDGSVKYIYAHSLAIADTDGRVATVVGMNLDETERQEARRERERLVHDLGERVKEITLLHGATRLLQPERKLDQGLLDELVVMIPPAWQYPECCVARISYLGMEAATKEWRTSPWSQSATFQTDDGVGTIEIAYLEERPPADEGPFLKEERSVLDSLAEILIAYLEVRRHHEGLEALVQIRTEELSVAVEAAQAAYRAKSAFLANMSHEIRTPMNAILGFGQLMERDADLSSKNRERLRRIMVAGEHLLELINNILEMSKAEAGRVRLVTTTFDLPLEVGHVTEMLRERIESKGLTFHIQGIAALPRFVRGDAGKLRQILINLLANAAKFTAFGSITLRASSRADGAHAVVTFEVEDTGPGIALREMEKVFEPFGQVGVGAAAAAGTGLGVPISRDFARLMGGDLTLRSVVGVGSVFLLEVRLEVTSAMERRRGPRDQGRVVGLEAGQRRPKILVADDTPDSRVALRELLAEAGIDVVEASTGMEVVTIFQEHMPDLILTDWKMPVIDGLEAVRRIRGTGKGAKVPVVVLSASVLEDQRAEVFESGANDFIPKPYRERDIWQALARHLGLRFVRRAAEPVARVSATAVTAAGMAALGEEALRSLAEALERGDMEQADRLLADTERSHPGVVAPLRLWLDEFAIDRVRAAIDLGLTASSPLSSSSQGD